MKDHKDHIEEKVSIETVKEAAQYSNLAQWFKMLVWGKMEGNQLPEKALDEIAEKLYEREKGTYAQARREAWKEVYDMLCEAIEKAVKIANEKLKSLPPST